MCNIKSSILCSCGEVDKSKPHWVLTNETQRFIVLGSLDTVDFNEFSNKRKEIADWLNSGYRFDKSFDLTNESILTIRIDDNLPYVFVYSVDKGWNWRVHHFHQTKEVISEGNFCNINE